MLSRSGLIVLEGLDGSGKSTQFERLSAYFSENDIKHKAIKREVLYLQRDMLRQTAFIR